MGKKTANGKDTMATLDRWSKAIGAFTNSKPAEEERLRQKRVENRLKLADAILFEIRREAGLDKFDYADDEKFATVLAELPGQVREALSARPVRRTW